jgi:exodeoxyribonuclease-3
MKIATWNVNSMNVRLPHVLEWLDANRPDVLVLQEIKQLTEAFPSEALQEIGYASIANGQKTYNGVAIISRSPATDPVLEFPGFEDPQRRVLAATIDGVRVVNLYIPNGQEVGSEKYDYKLRWLATLRDFLEDELTRHDKLVVLGDFNIAPADADVHDPEKWGDAILCSPLERPRPDRCISPVRTSRKDV